MHYQTTRILARNVHILVACYQLAFIYSPLHNWQYGLPLVQWVMFPLLCITGLWLMKGCKIWIWFQKKYGSSAIQPACCGEENDALHAAI